MISIRNIEVKRGGQDIIRSASFAIQPGKICVILGKNGAGKSTILETITGAITPFKGQILWDGHHLSELDSKKQAQRRAVLSQKTTIGFPLLVKEVVELGTYVTEQALSREKVRGLIKHALTTVGLETFSHRDYTTLSGGEQKRVLLAKCMVQLNCCHWADFNKYLILDEPTANLDIKQQYNFIHLVKRLVTRRKIGVFAVLHDLNLSAQFADHILLLNQGRIIAQGPPNQVMTTETLKETFGVNCLVRPHPVFDCPQITTLPDENSYQYKLASI